MATDTAVALLNWLGDRLTAALSSDSYLPVPAAAVTLTVGLSFLLNNEPRPAAAIDALSAVIMVAIPSLAIGCDRVQSLARKRLQGVGTRLGSPLVVTAGLTFEDAAVQEAYERWRDAGALWRSLDWLLVFFGLGFQVKLFCAPECGLRHHLWAGSCDVLCLARAFLHGRLSPGGRSAIGIGILLLGWLPHAGFLIAGDLCLGGLGREAWGGSVALSTMTTCMAFFISAMLTSVSHTLVRVKTALNLLGCGCISYLHAIFRNGGIDLTADEQGWRLMWIIAAVSVTSAISLVLNMGLATAGMSRYLQVISAQTRVRQR